MRSSECLVPIWRHPISINLGSYSWKPSQDFYQEKKFLEGVPQNVELLVKANFLNDATCSGKYIPIYLQKRAKLIKFFHAIVVYNFDYFLGVVFATSFGSVLQDKTHCFRCHVLDMSVRELKFTATQEP